VERLGETSPSFRTTLHDASHVITGLVPVIHVFPD
jgi:hypothetical protein